MLSICNRKSATDAKKYYQDHFADRDEYHFKGSEEEIRGEWVGQQSQLFGLSGEVEKEDFFDLIDGKEPRTGEQLLKNKSENRRVAFDAVFSAPKDVSSTWALADSDTQEKLKQAHLLAVKKATSYIETEAVYTRRGSGSKNKDEDRKEKLTGFTAARFDHHTSREDDPQIHSHLFIFNSAQRKDGTHGAIFSDELYQHVKSAGTLYRAELANELQKLGFATEPDEENNSFFIKGMSADLRDSFSQRASQIEEKAIELGREGTNKEKQILALTTRAPKTQKPMSERMEEWKKRASEFEFDSEKIESLKKEKSEVHQLTNEEIKAQLIQGITENEAVFQKKDIVLHLSVMMQTQVGGSDRVLKIADELLNEKEIIQLSDEKYSTREMIRLERQMAESAEALAKTNKHAVSQGEAAEAILTIEEAEGFTFSDEQKAGVHHMLTAGDLDVVIGAAGAGKTTAMKAANLAWEQKGKRVIGCSLSGKAADGLQQSSGIKSFTIHSLLSMVEEKNIKFGKNEVIVVDEAGMAGSRKLNQLIQLASEGGSKVVLVGDDKQLKEIEAGGAFRAIKERVGAVELVEHRRQKQEWQQEASVNMRTGNAANALAEYASRGHLHQSTDKNETMVNMVNDYIVSVVNNDLEDSQMIASTRKEVEQLNQLAREQLKESGKISEEEVLIAGKKYSEDERVIFTKNNYVSNYKNGTAGIIEEINGNNVSVRTDEGDLIRFKASEMEDLQHGYASTTHKSQGATIQKTFILAGGSMTDQNMAYVQLTRHKKSCDLYIDDRAANNLEACTQPTAKMIAFAESLAAQKGLELNEEIHNDFSECRDFLNKHAEGEKSLSQNFKWLAEAMSKEEIKESTLDYELEEVEV